MKKVIKYKREEKEFSYADRANSIQTYFNELISRDYEILYYSETPKGMILTIVVVLTRYEKIEEKECSCKKEDSGCHNC
jgi:hypothetical protein